MEKNTGRIGVDEAGKGDYFGYLVTAAVFVTSETEEKLKSLGVRDSKTISDPRIKELARTIMKICPYEIVKISPEKYNMLYKKFSSLNKMLAWSHQKAIQLLARKTMAKKAISDKFSDEKIEVEGVDIEQRINGESDIAVAAASILARDEFLKTLRQLGYTIGMVLPKGATHVEESAKKILEEHGEEGLKFVAKIHFKTTKKVLGKKVGKKK